MTERMIEQALEVIKEGNTLDALELIDVQTGDEDDVMDIKEETVRTALEQRAFRDSTLRNFVLKKTKVFEKLPRTSDRLLDRELVLSIVEHRTKLNKRRSR
ncbi:MAG: hypothetical protein ABJA64_02005 [Candidatus Saccharibacteria bacterium]